MNRPQVDAALTARRRTRKRSARRAVPPRDFHELSRIEQTAQIREWGLAGANEIEIVALTDWALADVRRVLEGSQMSQGPKLRRISGQRSG